MVHSSAVLPDLADVEKRTFPVKPQCFILFSPLFELAEGTAGHMAPASLMVFFSTQPLFFLEPPSAPAVPRTLHVAALLFYRVPHSSFLASAIGVEKLLVRRCAAPSVGIVTLDF